MNDPLYLAIRTLAVLGVVGVVILGPGVVGFVSIAAGFGLLAATIAIASGVYLIPSDNPIWNWCNNNLAASAALFLWITASGIAGALAGQSSRQWDAEREVREAQSEAIVQAAIDRRQMLDRARAEAEEQARVRAIVAEAHRLPRERVARAAQILASSGSAHEKVCAVRRELAAVPQASRRIPEILALLRELRPLERDALRDEQAIARDTRMVRCCDGELSPSCTCSRRSHRGCCSWHGGMCGCEPLPDDVSCPTP